MPWDPDDRKKENWGQSGQEGPPDFDKLIKKWIRKLTGGKSLKSGGKGGFFGIGLIVAIVLVLWVLSGIFIVSPAEQGVVLRFGKYLETVGPGPHWVPRFIESAYVVNAQRVSNFAYSAEMLTKDENIVSVSVAVQYRIDNPNDFLFNVVNPVSSLQQATASALRQVVGNTKLDDLLTTGRALVREQVAEQLNKTLALYGAGLAVTDVTLQPAKPPEAVTDAFDDAIKAREDEQRYINKAEAYARRVESIVQGQVMRTLQEANAYQKQIALDASAATARYKALLGVYKSSPQVTRERLYLDAVESMLSRSSKILVDVKGGNNVMYLPLNQLLREQKGLATASINEAKLSSDAADETSVKTSQAELPTPIGYSGGSAY